MNLPGITVTYLAADTITAHRLVVFNPDSERKVNLAIDGGHLIIGVTTLLDTETNYPVDVVRSGFVDVVYGGDVKVGDPLTADDSGAAIPAKAGDFIVGYAEESGAEGDIGSVWITPGQVAAGASAETP
ncbi:capsid cement protein [Providencia manganoxydans]|uniref:capsid cement protein n=1 Tax=Providencia manganoxydans TaxID=2923283 RepID=UPI0034E5E939